jgi:hypothetical protein
MLYATGAQQPVLVRIPLKHCVRAFRSSRDLEIAYWVNQRDSNGHVSFSIILPTEGLRHSLSSGKFS